MELWIYLFYLAFAGSLAQAVVWGPREGGGRGKGEIHPMAMEVPDLSEESLSDAATKAIDPASRLRDRRDAEDDSIGYTFPLTGDSHTFALVHWTGYPSEALFILTRRRTRESGYAYSDQSWLWRSVNYGHNFTNETNKWDSDTVAEWYYISPFSEYLIFTDRIHHRLYVTRDEGETYSRFNVNFRPDRLTFQSRYAINSTDDPYREYVLAYDSQSRSLWVSVNLGSNWRKLADNVVDNRYYWRSMPGIDGLGTVYFEKNVSDTESRLFVVRDVADANSTPVLFDASLGDFMRNTFVLEREYMFVQKVSTGEASSSPLWVSHNRNMFRQANFPLRVEERHYAVVDASEGQVFIAVYHDINNTNLYLSEAEGLYYSLSLQYIISPPESDWTTGYPRFDVHIVEGIVGTYIANQRVPGSRYGASVISYDKGGEWTYLIPPAVDNLNQPIICAPPDCSLHLHMESDRVNGYQSILSQDSAVGLLMALGNLGSSLSASRRNLRLYFSRDGGFSWFEVDIGSWEFQFAALGSVIVTVRKQTRTNIIKWSCNEGRSWTDTQFSNSTFGMNVIGMLTEREEKARHVTIFGYNYFARVWLIVDLNFTTVVPTLCAEDDYFQWVPTDDRPGSRCLLGEVITYERRNSTFCCYINPEYDRPVSRTPCPCTIEDFECDVGFQRISLNSPCTPLPWIPWPPPPPSDCTENGNYTITSGYRRVAGDRCVRGEETYFFELVRECPALPPLGLFIAFNIEFYYPNNDITFHLTQLQGWRVFTSYTWDFNDTTVVTVTGYDQGSTQTHSYTTPGNYIVTVRATNRAGSNETFTRVSVLDVLQNVSVVPPIQALSTGSAPTGIELVFRAQIQSRYGTEYIGRVLYFWSFGDGVTVNTTDPYVYHTYHSPGAYAMSVSARAAYSNVDATYHLEIYESARHVQIVSDSQDLGQWVVANELTNFHVERVAGFNEIIPSDTFYTWHVVPPSGLNPVTQRGSPFRYGFPRSGVYDLTVVGNHSSGSFSTQIHLTAEYRIKSVDVQQASTLHAGAQTVAVIYLKLTGNGVYTGFVSYHILSKTGDNVTDTDMAYSQGSLTVKFDPLTEAITKSQDISITFEVWNHVSNVSSDQSIGVLIPGDYGSISLKFTVSTLPPNYNTTTWMKQLQLGIVNVLQSEFSLNKDQVEFESTFFSDIPDFVTSTTPPASERAAQPSHGILKKRMEHDQWMVVNVNILPLSTARNDIKTIRNVSSELVKSGSVVVVVDGTQYTAEAEERIVDRIIIEPGNQQVITNNKLYYGIGGGLGAALILGVVSSVVLGVVIYYYRRRYNSLRVRYSRLSQAPVRFTFTQSGEILEEGDPDVDAVDTTCAETDKDDKPLN